MSHASLPGDDPDSHKAVTTSVARQIEPGREHDFVSWTDAGMALVRTFPGFLGGGWMKSVKIPGEYYVIYRFESEQQLDDWQTSPLRRHWLERGAGVSVERVSHRLSGIEGWFEPQSNLTNAVRVVGAPPPRWKQAICIWLGFFPLSLLIAWAVSPHLPWPAHGWGIWPRTLVATVINTPLMTYLIMPFITARLKPWLAKP